MSITKGAMLISNANAVGTELVNKLGGTGYKPVEWADAINLLGISNDDKASALASITEGTYTGDERGSIKYSNCNAVGSMLNKKFSTDRGFKPVEWESAISKLTPLAERTVSGSIVTFSDGADDVPTKSLIVTISTLSGVSAITETQTGRNLVALNTSPQQAKRDYGITVNTQTADALNITSTGVAYACERLFYSFKKGTYAIKYLATSSDSYTPTISIYRTNGTGVKYNIQPNTLTTFTLSEDTNIDIRLFASGSGDTNIRTVEYTNLQLEFGSTAHSYEPYIAPTTYTAQLGRTVYGGNADIVNGEGKSTHNTIDMGSLSWNYHAPSGNLSAYFDTYLPNDAKVGNNQDAFDGVTDDYTSIKSSQIALPGYDDMVMALGNGTRRFFLCDQRYSDASALTTALTGKILAYPLATPTDFTFTGQEIPTRLGYNAFWSDEGDTEVTYRKDPDIPDPPVQLLNTDNNENNDN